MCICVHTRTRVCIHTPFLIYNLTWVTHAVNTPVVVNLKLPNAELGRDARDFSGPGPASSSTPSGWPAAFEAKAYEVAKKLR